MFGYGSGIKNSCALILNARQFIVHRQNACALYKRATVRLSIVAFDEDSPSAESRCPLESAPVVQDQVWHHLDRL